MSSDYNQVIITGKDPKTGYPIDEYSHLVQKPNDMWEIGYTSTQLTNPYGSMQFVIGGKDDFMCFEHAFIFNNKKSDQPTHIVLHAIINSETGSFIQDTHYEVIEIKDNEEILDKVKSYIYEAIEWMVENDVKHSVKGWNQDQFKWYRYIAYELKMFSKTLKEDFSVREMHMGGKRVNKYFNVEGIKEWA